MEEKVEKNVSIGEDVETPTEEKETSVILNDDNHEWHDVDEVAAPIDTPLLVRVFTREFPASKTPDGIVYPETRKIAKWDGKEWNICGPFPKYEFDLLSENEKLREGSIITHWATPTEDDLNGWANRIQPALFIDHLELHVSSEDEPAIMSALYVAETVIANEINRISSLDLLPGMQERSRDLIHSLIVLQTLRMTTDFDGVIEHPMTEEDEKRFEELGQEVEEI